MITQGNFSVRFIQHASQDDDIAVNDLATALLGLSKAFERTNDLLNGERSGVVLQIKGTQSGSFESLLSLVPEMVVASNSILSSDFTTPISVIKDVIIGTKGIINLLKELKGKQPEVKGSDSPDFSYENRNGKIVISKEFGELFHDKEIRRGIQDLVSTLNNGIDRIDLTEQGKRLSSIEKHEVPYFTPVRDDVDVKTTLSNKTLSIITVSLESERGWRLREGENPVASYSMNDEEFMLSVRRGETRFGNGDVLVCNVNTTVETIGEKSTTKREIIKVDSHLEQPNLFYG